MTDISELKGQTLDNIIIKDDNEIIFITQNGDKYYMFHDQECCEDVLIEEVIGSFSDLIGTPILEAECEEGELKNRDDDNFPGLSDDCQWTFYKLGTIKGHVTIRWYGESNGYYSTGVSFRKNTKAWCS
jgi:hypothetical protein